MILYIVYRYRYSTMKTGLLSTSVRGELLYLVKALFLMVRFIRGMDESRL